jgi:hypothetical protein
MLWPLPPSPPVAETAAGSPKEEKPALPLPDKPSIAVLPFENLSGDPERERLADGITEDIITDLSRFRELFVIARNSTFVYKDKPVDVRQVAHELGVQYLLVLMAVVAIPDDRLEPRPIVAAHDHPNLLCHARSLAQVSNYVNPLSQSMH